MRQRGTFFAVFLAAVLVGGSAFGEQPYNLQVVNVTENALTITWTTANPVRGGVLYGQANGSLYQTSFDDRGCTFRGTTHFVTLEGLPSDSEISFLLHSGDTLYDVGGNPFVASTAPTLGGVPPLPTSTAFGAVTRSDCSTPLSDFIVYLQIEDHNGLGSGGTSALYAYTADAAALVDGRWARTLSDFRTAALDDYFEFSALDDNLTVTLQGGAQGTAHLEVAIGKKTSTGDETWEVPQLCPQFDGLGTPTGTPDSSPGDPSCAPLACGVWTSGSTLNTEDDRESYAACGLTGLTGGDVAYAFTPERSGSFDFLLAPVSGTGPLHLVVVDENGACLGSVAATSGTNSLSDVRLERKTYTIVVDGLPGSERRFSLRVVCALDTPTPAPTFTPAPTGTNTPRPTFTPTPVPSATPTATPDIPTMTPTPSPTETVTPEVPTATPTPTNAPTFTMTPTPGPMFEVRGVASLEMVPAQSCGMGFFVNAFATNDTNLGNVLGRYRCVASGQTGYDSYGANAAPAPLGLQFAGDNPPTGCGDTLRVTALDGRVVDVFLPENLNNEYGNSFTLWIARDGTPFYAATGDRRGLPDQTAAEAYQAGDVAVNLNEAHYVHNLTQQFRYDFISVPFCRENISFASDLFRELVSQGNDIRSLSVWNSASQSYSTVLELFPGVLSGDFRVTPNVPIRVESFTPIAFSLDGVIPMPGDVSFYLVSTPGTDYNFMSIPWYATSVTTASQLAGEIELEAGVDVRVVATWSVVGQRWTSYLDDLQFGDFDIAPGDVLRVEVDGNGLFTP